MYTIQYYSEAIEGEVLALPTGLLARYFALTDRMVIEGANLHEPHTKAMKGGLFELRLKSVEGIARVMYCTMVGKRIVMLHSFVKKTQKNSAKDLKLAIQRMKEIKNDDA